MERVFNQDVFWSVEVGMGAKIKVTDLPIEVLQKIFLAVLILVGSIVFAALVVSYSGPYSFDRALLLSTSVVSGADANLLEGSGTSHRVVFLGLAFAGEVLAFYLFYLIFEYVLSGQLKTAFLGAREMKKIKNLKGHYVICGGGRMGINIGERLKKAKKNVVFIEKEEDVVLQLKDMGFKVINANCLEEGSLDDAGVAQAHSLAAVLPNDGDNLLLLLTAKELNKNIKVAARASHPGIINKLKHAGANLVILPEVIGGIKLANAMLGKDESDYVISYD